MTEPDRRAAFAAMTEALIADFRAHGGAVTSGPFAGRPVLLLTTTGAQSGQPRLAPLVYSRDGEHYVVVASKGGAPTHPAWYHNLLAHPIVTVEVGAEKFEARAPSGRRSGARWALRAALLHKPGLQRLSEADQPGDSGGGPRAPRARGNDGELNLGRDRRREQVGERQRPTNQPTGAPVLDLEPKGGRRCRGGELRAGQATPP